MHENVFVACVELERGKVEPSQVERPCVESTVQCTATCGQGIQTRNVECIVAGKSGSVRPDEDCRGQLKPNESRLCVLEPCGAQWLVSDWSRVGKRTLWRICFQLRFVLVFPNVWLRRANAQRSLRRRQLLGKRRVRFVRASTASRTLLRCPVSQSR